MSSRPVPLKTRDVGERCPLNLSRAQTSSRCNTKDIGDGLRNYEPWSNDEDETWAGNTCTSFHSTPTGRLQASKNLTCISSLQGGSSNSRHAGHEFVTLTNGLPRPLAVQD
ncbi:hypothetical protein TNCV_1003721 [Trichonephila clavipes]|nr:hypothetical protein TNCV_1003721 [Trichonephila clavipes]